MADEIEPASNPEDAPSPASLRPYRMLTPSELMEQEDRSKRLILLSIRLLFMVMLVTVTVLTVASKTDQSAEDFQFSRVVGLFLAASAIGALVLLIDAKTPNKRLTSVVGIYLGLCAGLLGALAIGALIDVVARAWSLNSDRIGGYLGLGKVMVAIILCYLGISIVLTTKDDFRLVIPYVEFAKQVRGVRPLLLDTSVLIDGRLDAVGQSGFIDAPIIVPHFVIEELQMLADSGDKLKRARGRRGLSMVSKLQSNPYLEVSIDSTEIPRKGVDHMLLQLAGEQSLRILTTDYNLNKVAQIRGISVINLNDVTNSLKSQAIPGETLEVEVVKRGEAHNQGVGYMPDGTMVVIEDAADRIGETVTLTVTNSLQTTAGRMIFGTAIREQRRLHAEDEDHFVQSATPSASHGPNAGQDASRAEPSHVPQIARAATNQPRTPVRSAGGEEPADAASRRNPRRG